jgi:hypothetical protein
MIHKILPTQIHTIQNDKGVVKVYTEKEYQHLTWWQVVKHKYNIEKI